MSPEQVTCPKCGRERVSLVTGGKLRKHPVPPGVQTEETNRHGRTCRASGKRPDEVEVPEITPGERLWRFKDGADVLCVSCPRCFRPAGELCRTDRGKVHQSRYTAATSERDRRIMSGDSSLPGGTVTG